MANDIFTPTITSGTGTYAWSNAGNWSAGLPDQNAAATITSTTLGYTLLIGGVYTVNQAVFGTGTGILGMTIASGDSLTATNGSSVASGTTLTINAASAGSLVTTGLEVDSSATLNVLGGTFSATGAGLTLDNNATALFGSGVTLNVNVLNLNGASNLTLDVGSSAAPHVIANVNDGSGSSTLTVSGGDLQLGSGGGGTYVVNNGGVIEFTGNLNSGASIGLNGGRVQLDSNVNLQSGDKFIFAGTATSTLDVVSSNNFQNGFSYAVTGFDYGDKLQFGSLNLTGDTYTYAGTTLTIQSGSQTVLTISNLSLALDAVAQHSFLLSGNTIQLACFLAGTLIETADGAVPVERLRPGDSVLTLRGDERVMRRARWIGSRHIRAACFAGHEDAHPVRIRAGAFAANLPRRDLLVTGEHCIHIEGGLIPARMLVNGRSIVRDTTIDDYTVYHVEFDGHSIMLAEGLPTESYLDTGNRDSFGEPNIASEHQGRWPAHAAAPLRVEREAVEPIWQALQRRADRLGLAAAAVPVLSDDPDLCLQLEDGRTLRPRWCSEQRHLFQLPAGARPSHLLSRAARPSEVVGAFADDRRLLGVAVSRITLWSGLSDTVLRDDALSGSGWHASEGGHRWTDGRASLVLPDACETDGFLEVRLAARMRYPLRPEPGVDIAA